MGDVLTDMKRTKDYLVCIDSDGCLLDNMELKHKECFCPAVVNVWNLQGASKYVREVHEWVNLYSRSRGWNRFPAVVRTLELSYARPELKERGYVLPDLSPLKKWIEETPSLSAVAIDEYAKAHPDCDPLLLQAAQWSREVDANIAHIVRGILPFPGVREAILKLKEFADVVVVSATPHDALVRELTAVGIAPLMTAIAGQELGTKSQCIRKAMSHGYAPDHVLKIGDAPSDYKAAQDNGVLFNPIVAGDERNSWLNVREVSAEKFKNGTFNGDYQESILKDFFDALAEEPDWKVR
ncbi:MAG: HAD family hydrolase [Spirochaetales bacterium]|nr:HAD family hydrolase [Spirochaetales bacterium]